MAVLRLADVSCTVPITTTHHIVVGHIQGSRIWYTTFRDPALRLVFCTYEVLHFTAQVSA
jgi:hypothetical protein